MSALPHGLATHMMAQRRYVVFCASLDSFSEKKFCTISFNANTICVSVGFKRAVSSFFFFFVL